MKTLIRKILLSTCILQNFSCQGQVNQPNQVRQPAVAGSFYPAEKQSLIAQLNQFFNNAEDETADNNVAAVIVPHAGYVYSGQVAASAFAKINPDKVYSRIFLIGTSHHVLLNGASIFNQGNYETPLGTVQVDTALATKLIEQNKLFEYQPEAHTKEHCLEVQLPFLQYRLKKPFKIVPIIIGTQSPETCKKLSETLQAYFTPENLFVISSDFSHYPSYDDAVENDQRTGDAIASNSSELFSKILKINENKHIPGLQTSCCGWSSVLTLLNITSKLSSIKVSNIQYKNSGDSPYGDNDRVVGYHAFTFSREKDGNAEQAFVLTTEDKKKLLQIARETIAMKLDKKPLPLIDENELSENLKLNCGAFVTLHKKGSLRGCIGRFTPNEPLYKVVQQMAMAAAFNDHRFDPLTREELDDIDIEISVLTPLKKIKSIDEFELGKHGIYIIQGNQSGTFLPQVAKSTQWSKEEFLGHCARDKAKIGWDGWKDAELYTYEALIFDEGSSR